MKSIECTEDQSECDGDAVRVKQLQVAELARMLEQQAVTLFDVRPPDERALASIAEARPLDASGQEYLFALDPGAPVALLCHHGIRSQHAAQQLLQEGFRNVYNVRGGIDAWSQQVDANVPRY